MTKEDEAKLAELNAAVKQAILARTEWLDAKMLEYSDVKPGDNLYDLDSGEMVGKVRKLERFWRDRDEGVRDTSVSWYYEYQVGHNSFDNTSRQPARSFGTLRQAQERAEWRLARIKERTA